MLNPLVVLENPVLALPLLMVLVLDRALNAWGKPVLVRCWLFIGAVLAIGILYYV